MQKTEEDKGTSKQHAGLYSSDKHVGTIAEGKNARVLESTSQMTPVAWPAANVSFVPRAKCTNLALNRMRR